MNIETIKFYYENGLWNHEQLDKLFMEGKLTDTQYEEITGTPYTEK